MSNPYNIDNTKLNESEEITDEKKILKYKLVSEFIKITSKMKSDEVISATKLHKSDLSRLRAMDFERFTLDRIIGLLNALGYSTSIKVEPKKAS